MTLEDGTDRMPQNNGKDIYHYKLRKVPKVRRSNHEKLKVSLVVVKI